MEVVVDVESVVVVNLEFGTYLETYTADVLFKSLGVLGVVGHCIVSMVCGV